MMDSYISQNTTELMARSREIALEFGADGITSLHIFLADCSINNIFSIRNFAFKSEMDFNEFYQAQFTNPKTKSKFTKEADVPLTIPAEQAIRGARSQQKKTLDLKLEPHHIFLAMSNLKKSQFVSIFPNSNNLYDDLIDYYKKNGCISYIKQKQTILEKIRKYIKSNRK